MTHVKPLSVTAAVLERDGRILIAQRRQGALAGYWEFPGGKLEPGEAPAAGLRRELREELGVETEIGEFLLSTIHHYPELSVELLVYRARLVSGQPVAHEHAALAWVTLDEIRSYRLAPADWPVVDALMRK